MDWVVNSEGEPYLCPLRGTNCTKRCALYGEWDSDKGCAIFQIANTLYDIEDGILNGLDVNNHDGDQ